MSLERVAAAAVGGPPQVIPGECTILLPRRVATVWLKQLQDLVCVAAVPCLLGQPDLRHVETLFVLGLVELVLLLQLLVGSLPASQLVLIRLGSGLRLPLVFCESIVSELRLS